MREAKQFYREGKLSVDELNRFLAENAENESMRQESEEAEKEWYEKKAKENF